MHLRPPSQKRRLGMAESPPMPVLPKKLLMLGARLQMTRTAVQLRRKETALPAQNRTFRGLMRQLARTEYGRANSVIAGMSYSSFQKRVPLQTYAKIAPLIERMKRGEA